MRSIRKLSFVQNARLVRIALFNSMKPTQTFSDVLSVDYTQRGKCSAECDSKTGEVVFKFADTSSALDYMRDLGIA